MKYPTFNFILDNLKWVDILICFISSSKERKIQLKQHQQKPDQMALRSMAPLIKHDDKHVTSWFFLSALARTKVISRLVTVIIEEDQINTPTCSPGAFIRQLTEGIWHIKKDITVSSYLSTSIHYSLHYTVLPNVEFTFTLTTSTENRWLGALRLNQYVLNKRD